jgi:hypothetical protein
MTSSPSRRPAPPSGQPPPSGVALADGTRLDLEPLAREVCARYAAEFPDEEERYGEAGHQWCLHDNQYLLSWAVLDQAGFVDLEEQVAWLARVLEARTFPLDRLARDLEIAADVLGARVPAAEDAARRLEAAAVMVRARGSFLGHEPGGY